jgi:hypothetical protein
MNFSNLQDPNNGQNKDDEMILKVDYHGKKCFVLYDDEKKSLSFPTFMRQLALKFGITSVEQNSADDAPVSSSKCATKITVSSDQSSSDKNNVCVKIYVVDADGDKISIESHGDIILAFRVAEKLPLDLFVMDTSPDFSLSTTEISCTSVLEEDCNQSKSISPVSDFQIIEKEDIDEFLVYSPESEKADNQINQEIEFVSSKLENSEVVEKESTSTSFNIDDTAVLTDRDRKTEQQEVHTDPTSDPIDFFIAKMKQSFDIHLTRLQIVKFLELSRLPKRRLMTFQNIDIKTFLSIEPDYRVRLIMYDAYEQLSLLVEEACKLNGIEKMMMSFKTFRIVCRSLGVWPKRFVKLEIVSPSVLTNPRKGHQAEDFVKEKEKNGAGKLKETDAIDVFIHKFQVKNGCRVTREQFVFLNSNFLKLPAKRIQQVKKIDLESENLRNPKDQNGFMILVDIHNQILAKGNENETISLELFQLICRSLKVWPARFVKLNLVNTENIHALALSAESEKKRLEKETKKLEKHLLKEQKTLKKEAKKLEKQEAKRQKQLKKKKKVEIQNDLLEACLSNLTQNRKVTITKAQLIFFSNVVKLNYKRLNKFVQNPKEKFGSEGKKIVDAAYMKIYSQASDEENMDVETFSALLRYLGVSPKRFVNLNVIENPTDSESDKEADSIEKDIEKVVFEFATKIVKVVSTAIKPLLKDDSVKGKRKRINKDLNKLHLKIQKDLNGVNK